MANPFPVPDTAVCPYCGESAGRVGGVESSGVVNFEHELEKRIKVGEVLNVTLVTLHEFSMMWIDSEWKVVANHQGIRREQVRCSDGHYTGWVEYRPQE